MHVDWVTQDVNFLVCSCVKSSKAPMLHPFPLGRCINFKWTNQCNVVFEIQYNGEDVSKCLIIVGGCCDCMWPSPHGYNYRATGRCDGC